MKASFLFIFLTLTLPFFATANTDCIWTSHKAGVTINYVAPCNFENQSFIDSVLNKVISLLNRQDTSLKILVLINHRQLSFPGDNLSSFFSIGYDTLQLIDDDFIFDYYQNKTVISEEGNNGVNRFESRLAPIDINSTKNGTKNQIGIKIIYDRDYSSLGNPDWKDIINAIVYSAKNPDRIKSGQKRDTVRYNTNGWYISLVTLDTFNINKILGKVTELKQPKQTASVWALIILSFAAIFYLIFTSRYFLVLRKSTIFTGKIKVFHLIMIWLIPFIWILILKSLTKPTPGSYEVKNKVEPKPFSNNDSDAANASNMGY